MLPQAIAASTFCFEPANKFHHHAPRQLPIIFSRLHWQSLFRTLNEEFPESGMLSRSQRLEPSIEIIAWPATTHPGFLETCCIALVIVQSTVVLYSSTVCDMQGAANCCIQAGSMLKKEGTVEGLRRPHQLCAPFNPTYITAYITWSPYITKTTSPKP